MPHGSASLPATDDRSRGASTGSSAGISPADAAALALLAPIASELIRVEKVFDNELESDLPAVNTLVKHVRRFRGKMLRPILLLLTGKAAAPDADLTEAHIRLAATVEMVHMSTLVHDDVLDEAELRRKGATLNHLRGNEAAVLLGDYLISHSYHLCSSVDPVGELDARWAARVIGATTNRLCEGELLQIDNRNNLSLDEETYYEIVRRKTGALTATSCLLGARFSGASEAVGQAMDRFGEIIGIAFQVQDDVLDLVGSTREVGKTLGIDVEKQKLTLPLIHFLQHAPAEHRELLTSLLRSREPDRAERIRNLVLPSSSVDFARAAARKLTEDARRELQMLPESDIRAVLEGVCDFVVSRQH